MKKILIVEDDKKLNEGIYLALKNDSRTFFQCRTIFDAKKLFLEQKFSLILLDLNLPDGNGMELLRSIRRSTNVPVIIITVNNTETDIVTALESGANDYVTKPFSLMVLRARVAVWLREQEKKEKSRFQIDDFDFDFEHMEFKKAGVHINLSKTEQKLLRILCENRGATLKRERLIDYIWAGDTEFVDEHALTVTVKRLRDKLGDNSNPPVYIKTVYGLGYTWTVKA